MKKIILGTALLLGFVCANAQSEKFTAAMKKNITAIDTALRNPQSLLTLANNFERIGAAEKNQWLPYYYAAMLQADYGFMQSDMSGNDPLVEKATALIAKADSLSPKNSEISVVKAMIATVHMIVNPQARYMEDGATIQASLEAAKAQDPANPRPYLFKGESLKGTPEQFGGGCGPATEQLKLAAEKFATFKPASDIAPSWGAERTKALLAECK